MSYAIVKGSSYEAGELTLLCLGLESLCFEAACG